jgi:hypothetical protein
VRSGGVALVGGRVRTLDAVDRVAEALLIEDGTITAVGASTEIRRLAGDAVEVVELDGRTVLPGMIDAHTHVELSTLADHFLVVIRELDVPTVLERVRDAARQAPAGAWIVGQGTFGQRLPARADLDAAAPEHPVVLRQSMHRQVASTLALARAGIDRRFVAPHECRVERDERGDPTGVVEEGFDLFPVPRPPQDALARALAFEVRDRWLRHGVTTIHELPASTAGTRAWQDLHRAGELPCRMVLNPILAPGHQATVSSVESFTRLGLMTGFGDPWLRFGSLKLFLDGAGCAGLHHAQLSGPARGWGLQNFLYGELVRILADCRDARVHVWMHAVGDAAHTLAIDAVEEVNLACGNGDHRTRIEHIPRATADFSVFERLRRAGIVPVPTAAFMHFEPDDRETSLPPGGRLFPYRTLIASGLLPPGNSDTAGTQPFAANPWHGVALMALRRNRNGVEFARDEAVGTAESVLTYTRNGAYAGFEEHLKGSLEPGKLGDVAVYADDPYALDAEVLVDLEADLTIVGGRLVHRRDASAGPTRRTGAASGSSPSSSTRPRAS